MVFKLYNNNVTPYNYPTINITKFNNIIYRIRLDIITRFNIVKVKGKLKIPVISYY